MAQTTFSRSEEANVVLLEEKLRREHWKKLFFSRFVGFTTEDDMGSLIPSGKPIETLNRFATEGSDSLLIPMLRRLQNEAVYGDVQMKGKEEAMSIYYNKVYINQLRNAVKVGGRISNQRVKKFNLFAKARPLLEDWMAQFIEYSFMMTFMEGWSPNVFKNTTVGGLYINSGQKRCHPNFWAAGTGFATYSATDSTYEGNVDTAVSGVTNTSTDLMSTDLLEELRVAAKEKNIQPMLVDGIEFLPMVIHSKQAKQLRADSNWINAQKDANIRGSKNPIFQGTLGTYAGFVIWERELIPAVDPTGTGTVSFGYNTAMFGRSALSDSARKVGILFGAQSLAYGWAEGPYFDNEIEDYGNMKGVAAGIINGATRGEFHDSTSSPTAVINQSSIAFCTYSA